MDRKFEKCSFERGKCSFERGENDTQQKAIVTGIWHENKEWYWLYWAIALFILDKVSIQALKYILAFIINHARI